MASFGYDVGTSALSTGLVDRTPYAVRIGTLSLPITGTAVVDRTPYAVRIGSISLAVTGTAMVDRTPFDAWSLSSAKTLIFPEQPRLIRPVYGVPLFGNNTGGGGDVVGDNTGTSTGPTTGQQWPRGRTVI